MNDDEKPDWLTEMDEEILDALSRDLILSPSIIAENIDRSREGVSNRLNSLQAGDLVEKVGRGKYRLTDDGMQLFFEKVELSEAQRIGNRREEVKKRRRVQRELGITLEEFQSKVEEEHSRIKEEKPKCEDPLAKAFENVENDLRESNSTNGQN